jgi:hypothetical protein
MTLSELIDNLHNYQDRIEAEEFEKLPPNEQAKKLLLSKNNPNSFTRMLVDSCKFRGW